MLTGHKLLETRCASAEEVRWLSAGITPTQLDSSKAGSPGFLDLGWHLMAVGSVLHCYLTVPAAVDCSCLPIVSAVEELLSSYYVSLTCLCVAVFAIV